MLLSTLRSFLKYTVSVVLRHFFFFFYTNNPERRYFIHIRARLATSTVSLDQNERKVLYQQLLLSERVLRASNETKEEEKKEKRKESTPCFPRRRT